MDNTDAIAIQGKPGRSWFRTLGRGLLWTVLLLLLLIVLLLGITYWLAGTDSGFARISSLANEHVAGLSIEQSGGNLREGISAESLNFSNDAIDIKAVGLSSGWQLKCLMRKRFCLNDLHIETLDVVTRATEKSDTDVPRTGPVELPSIGLPIDVSISDISIATLKFQGPDDAPLQLVNDIRLSASTAASVVTISNVSLAYQQFRTQLAGTIELQNDYPINLILGVNADDVLPESVPEGSGSQPLQLNSQLSGSVADLVVDATISGVVDVSINATLKPLEQNLPATLSIASDTLGWPITSKSQVLASDTRIGVSGSMDDYDLSLSTTVSGEQLPETGISITGVANTERVTLPGISVNTLGGTASGSALVSLAEPMVWSTDWRIRNIDPSLQVPDLSGLLNGRVKANGALSSGKWSLNLEQATIEGALRELPFRLDTKLAKGLNDLWVIQHVNLENDRNQLKAQGIVGDTLDLKADINLPQLQNFMPGLAGGFDAKLIVDGALATPHIVVDANAEVLRFNDILVQSLAITADIEELFVQDSTLDINVNTIRAGENTVSDANLSLTGRRVAHQLGLKADGPQKTRIDLALSGNLDDSLNWSGVLEKVQAALPGHSLSLAEPAIINWQNDDQQVSVSPHCWNLAERSSLCLEDEFNTAASGNTSIALDTYALDQLNAFLPENTRVGGDLGANVALRWGDSGPDDKSAIVSLTIDEATVKTVDGFGEAVAFGYDTIAVDADVAPDDANGTIKLSSQRLGNAQFSAQLDPSNADSPLSGTIALDGLQLEIAKAFLPDFDEVSGTLSAAGKLGGVLSAPQYNGNVVLDSPILEAEILPLPITGGRVVARINGQSLALEGQILSNDGQIGVTGRGTLDPQNWNADVTLTGENLSIQSDPLQESNVNHNIRIEANPRRLSVSGDVDVPFAVIDVAELPQGAATVSSDIVVIEDIEEETAADEAKSELNMSVALDISLGDEVSLSAYGLTANLTGDMDLQIRGSRPPQLGGEIRVVDGIFKKYGQDLEANGQIIFVGPVEGARLDIDAIRLIENEEPEREAGLRIQGTVATPEITLFTNPADKNQDAILSYIILGRDINEASDQEADLVQTAALALAVRGGKSIGGGLANALGVKEFGLETRGSGDNAELIVSGRINDRLLLSYGRGVFDSQSTLSLRYDLTKKLYLEAATSAAESAADLFYSFSF